jgi:type IV secretory pathway VirB10-like protein
MIHVNLLSNRHQKFTSNKTNKRVALLFAALFAFVTGSCTTSNSAKNSSDVVDASEAENAGPALQDVPDELRYAHRFDPAATLDPKVVQESDFYQIKKTIEQNRAVLEAAWKEQEAIEARVKAAASAEKQRKADLAKQEEEELARKRQEAAAEYERTKDLREKYENEANERVKKLPTIRRSDEVWRGLED